jgi:hypothetical protein
MLRPFVLALALSGCAIADKSDKLNAEVEFSLGGLLANLVDIKLKASIGFSKTCPIGEGGTDAPDVQRRDVPGGAGGPDRGFL